MSLLSSMYVFLRRWMNICLFFFCAYKFSVLAEVLQRESWQNITTYLVSKAQVASFCLELTRKLNMRYQSPPLPVDLAMVTNRSQDCDSQSRAMMDEQGIKEIVALFQSKKDR